MNIEVTIIGQNKFKYKIESACFESVTKIIAIEDTTDYTKYGTEEFKNTSQEYNLLIDKKDLHAIVIALQKILF